MSKLLTPNGRDILNRKISETQVRLKQVVSQKGDAYENGGNGWHDNFSFEQLVREEAMLAGELASLNNILSTSVMVQTSTISADEICIGTTVTFEDENASVVEYAVVGFGETDVSSNPKKLEYLAPLIDPFIGGSVGDEHTVRLGGRKVTYRVTNIRRSE